MLLSDDLVYARPVLDAVLSFRDVILDNFSHCRDKILVERDHCVTSVDIDVGDGLVAKLRDIYPSYSVVSEHYSDKKISFRRPSATAFKPKASDTNRVQNSGKKRGDSFCWLIDPIDGTKNYIHMRDDFVVSVALADHSTDVVSSDDIVFGMIYVPAKDMVYVAESGMGAYAIDLHSQVSHRLSGIVERPTNESIIGIEVAGADAKAVTDILDVARRMQYGIRVVGCTALSITQLALSEVDAVIIPGFRIWDAAAGITILREAGIYFSSYYSSSEDPLSTNSIIGGNRVVCEQMRSVNG